MIIILIMFYLIPKTYSQLLGNYTVGGNNADFQTIQIAVDSVCSQGISGHVTLNINPGIYPGFTINNIPGATDTSKVTFQPSNLDSSSVVIQGKIILNHSNDVTINKLTISTGNLQSFYIDKSNNVLINSCFISSTMPTSAGNAIVVIRHFFDNEQYYSNVTLNRCSIISTANSIYCSGHQGSTLINECTITSSENRAIYTSSTTTINVNNSNIYGDLEINVYLKSNFRNNSILGNVDIFKLDSLINTTIVSSGTQYLTVKYLKNNYINALATHFWCSPTLLDNHFLANVSITSDLKVYIIGNVFIGNLSTSNNALLFKNNYVKGNFHYGDVSAANWDYTVSNNIFSTGHVTSTGHHSTISYNNFIDSAYLYLNYYDIMVYDNNFCLPVKNFVSFDNIKHNNFFPIAYFPYDTNQTNYDPMYEIDNPGIATNPLLQGKGWSAAPEIDYLKKVRNNPPAIGANEIFIGSENNSNVIHVPCGEKVYLNVSESQDSVSCWWSPDTCFLHPDSAYTFTIPHSDCIVYLNDSIHGVIDSIMIFVEPFPLEIAPTPIFLCSYSRKLNATYHPNASYHWTPEIGLSNPNIRNPELLITDTNNLQYILECQIEGCGSTFDTVTFVYSPLPNVIVYQPSQYLDVVFFSCDANCTDSFLWDFGDGTFSNEEDPYHTYQVNGIYTVTLTLTNSFGTTSGSFDYNYFFDSSIPDSENRKTKVFPNPVSDKINITGLPEGENIRILIFNALGKLIKQIENQNEQTYIDVNDVVNGVYTVQILKNDIIVSAHKIVILH